MTINNSADNAEFVAWFVQNYPEHCVIASPIWHAPKIYRAATHRLIKELEARRRNAERYQWLKANYLQTGPDSWIRTGEDLEEAIDAAINKATD